MKKIIALLVALALFTTSVFAAPLSVAAKSSDPVPAQAGVSSEQTQRTPEALSAIDETGDLFVNALFADVAATPLTPAEAEQIEGGIGPAGAAVIAAVALVSYVANMVMDATKKRQLKRKSMQCLSNKGCITLLH